MSPRSTLPLHWDLTPLLSGDDDPSVSHRRAQIEEVVSQFANRWRSRRDYLKDAAVLREALDEYEALHRQYGTGGDEEYYFSLRTAQDQNDPTLKAKDNQVSDFSRNLDNTLRFFELNLSRLPAATRRRFLADSQLAPYTHFLEHLFSWSPYLLSEAEENILSLKVQTSYLNWVTMVAGFLAKEEREVPVGEGKRERSGLERLLSLTESQDKTVRDAAAAAANDIFTTHLDEGEVELNSVLGHKKSDDQLRKLSRPDLATHIRDDIATEVVEAMLGAVERRNTLAHRYYRLKAQLLGVPRLAYHERNVAYGRLERKIPYPEAVELVEKVFLALDPDFAQIFHSLVQDGQIDVYPETGKRNGAFCAHGLLTQPTYILLNYTDTVRDVLTIAHEAGHAINNELMRRSQNALNFRSPLSTAEVASTFMEDFVLDELLRTADEEERLALLVMKLNGDISTIFRQVAAYRFEQELHRQFREQGYLSKVQIGALFQKHMAAYMGEAVEQSPGAENWWLYWSHLRTFFYVYSYASGLLISKSLQGSVRENAGFITQVKEFLGVGSSQSPKEAFAQLGVNIADRAFWEGGLAEVERLLEETEHLADRLGKRIAA